MEHPSLDEIRAAITARLEEKSAESGVSIQVNYQNAQGDPSRMPEKRKKPALILPPFPGKNKDRRMSAVPP